MSEIEEAWMDAPEEPAPESEPAQGPARQRPRELDTSALAVEVTSSLLLSFTDGLREPLGSGTFGNVYKGVMNGDLVAVKVFKEKDFDKSGLQTELQVLSSQRHCYLVSLRAYCKDPPALVYEFLGGGDLAALIKSFPEKLVSWKDRLRMALEISTGLRYLHDQKPQAILHLDLKPANILITSDGRCKLADFGLARFSNQSVTARGTPGFMDPNVMVSARVDQQSDVYSLGRVLLHLFTGISGPAALHKVTAAYFRTDKAWQEGLMKRQTGGFFSWAFNGSRRREEPPLVALIMKNLDRNAGTWPQSITRLVVRLALQCASRCPDSRPKLQDVCRALEDANAAVEMLPVHADGNDPRNPTGGRMPTLQPPLQQHPNFWRNLFSPQEAKRGPEIPAKPSFAVEASPAAKPTPPPRSKVAPDALVVGGSNLREFSLKELEDATERFAASRALGESGLFVMHKGFIRAVRIGAAQGEGAEHVPVVVKRVQKQVLDEYDQFISMVQLLGKVQHSNLEQVMGFCLERGEAYLVCQWYEKGCLTEALAGLTWDERMRVAKGVAKGLACLHDTGIYHRALRSSAVLVGADGAAVLTGWELSGQDRRDNMTSHVVSTFAHLGELSTVDPCYVQTGHFSNKSDVFSLGVIFLELLSGRRADKENLIPRARSMFKHREWQGLVDPAIVASCNAGVANLMFGLIHRATSYDLNMRPSAKDIVEMLEKKIN